MMKPVRDLEIGRQASRARNVGPLANIMLLVAVAMIASACGKNDSSKTVTSVAKEPPTNHIEVPSHVRQSLGITFAAAKSGKLEQVETAPGTIVARPDRRWTVTTPLAGTVTQIATIWQTVRAGDVVAEIASPDLAQWQAELHQEHHETEEAQIALDEARAATTAEQTLAKTLAVAARESTRAVADAEAARDEADRVAKATDKRLARLTSLRDDAVSAAVVLEAREKTAEARRHAVDAVRRLTTARVEAAELVLKATKAAAKVDTTARRLELLTTHLATTESAFEQRLRSIATLAGTTVEALTAIDKTGDRKNPAWATLRTLPMRAPADGTVVLVRTSTGTWSERDEILVEILDTKHLMFRATIPETDVATFPEDLVVRLIVPGSGDVVKTTDAAIRPVADEATRSLLLEAMVADPNGMLRIGMSADAQILVRRSSSDEVLVPANTVVRDGLDSVVFRRDPNDPDHVVRTVVVVGASSGGWTELYAGVAAGDEVVQSGVYQLRETGLGRRSPGGHYHADGTWHAGDH